MNSDWKWRSALVFAVAICYFLAIRLFSSSTVTYISSAGAVLVALINLVFGKTEQKELKTKPIDRLIAKLLQVNGFVRVVTYATILIAVLLATYTILNALRESQLRTISGYVQENDGSLARNSSVTLIIGSNTLKTLAPDGRFSFPRVQLPDKNHRIAIIEAQWNGKKTTKTIDLDSGNLTNEVIRLPQGHAPFRVQYFLLGGHAIDFFLAGKVDPHWERQLAGQPYIVPDSTFKKLSVISMAFTEPFGHTLLLTPDYYARKSPEGMPYSSEAEESARRLATQFQGMPVFIGTDASIASVTLTRSASLRDIESLSDASAEWHAESSPSGVEENGIGALTFWRFGTSDDLVALSRDQFGKHMVKWLQYATKGQFPKDFCVVLMDSGSCVSDRDQNIAVHFRSVWLRIAVIENLSTKSIRIGSFLVRQNERDNLRTRDEDQLALKAQEPRPQDWFAPQDLDTGEKIAVPLEIVLRFDKEKNWSLYHLEKDSAPEHMSVLVDQFRHQRTVKFQYHADRSEHKVLVPTDTLLQIMNKPRTSMEFNKEYIYGPSTKIEELVVDDAEYHVRQFDPRLIAIRNGDETGSCPFVYSYSASDSSWVDEGRILFGANGRDKESTDSIKLDRLDGMITVREEEPEITFLRSVYISARDHLGNNYIFHPTNWKSLNPNGGYIKLNQGESIKLLFPPIRGELQGTLRLVARGYYQPYREAGAPLLTPR